MARETGSRKSRRTRRAGPTGSNAPLDRTKRTRKIGDIVAELITRRGLGRVDETEELEQAWREAIGSPGDGYTRVGRLNGRTLEILVDHAILVQELNYHMQTLLDRLAKSLPERKIETLKFRVVKK